MNDLMKERLEEAVMRYVDGMDVEMLVHYVTEDLCDYFINKASAEDVKEFVEAMEVGR